MKHFLIRSLAAFFMTACCSTWASAQQFHLVKDINTTKSGRPISNTVSPGYQSNTQPYPVLNSIAYFMADDGLHGKELWRSDGSAAGTYMMKDIYAGWQSSTPKDLTICNGKLFFTAFSEGLYGLWVSDGSSAGTVLLMSGGQPSLLTTVGGLLYFQAANTLYKTDGTVAGTKAGLYFQSPYGSVRYMYSIHGKLFFSAFGADNNSGESLERLWISDGSAAGTKLISNDARDPAQLTEGPGDLVYFSAHDKFSNQRLLYVSNSEPGNAAPVAGNNNISLTPYGDIISMNGVFYFMGSAGGPATALYRYNAQAGPGVQLVKNFTTQDNGSGVGRLVISGGKLYITASVYVAATGNYKVELWTSDGTTQHTLLLSASTEYINLMADINGTLYYASRDSLHGMELWKSNGTVAGTVMVRDIMPGPASSNAGNGSSFALVGNKVLFSAYTSAGYELWATDGSSAGTALLKDINQSVTSSSSIAAFTPYKDLLFFTGDTSDVGQKQFFKSNGSNSGTIASASFLPALSYPPAAKLPVINDSIYSFGTDLSLSKTGFFCVDVNTLKSRLIKDFTGSGVNMGWQAKTANLIYFATYTKISPALLKWTLWRSDGTAEGTFSLASDSSNIASSPVDAPPVAMGNILYFTTYGATPANFLWRTDGTKQGTFTITDTANNKIINPRFFTVFNNKLCFWASDFNRLWSVDAARKFAVALPGDYERPDYPAVAGNKLFFKAHTPNQGYELWSADTTMSRAAMVKDIYPGFFSSDPSPLAAVGKLLFFFARDETHGYELWKSDGTAAGTVLLKDVNPGPASPSPGYNSLYNIKAVEAGGKLFLEINGQLWSSDGTDTGTHQINDPAIADVTAFNNLTVVGNSLWFTGVSYQYGEELYTGEIAPVPLHLYTFTGNGDFDNPANWLEGQVPPENILQGMEVVIKPAKDGQFILNKPLHFKGGKLTLGPGAKMKIKDLLIQ